MTIQADLAQIAEIATILTLAQTGAVRPHREHDSGAEPPKPPTAAELADCAAPGAPEAAPRWVATYEREIEGLKADVRNVLAKAQTRLDRCQGYKEAVELEVAEQEKRRLTKSEKRGMRLARKAATERSE